MIVKRLRILAAGLAAVSLLAAAPSADAQVQTHRVVGTGDSILSTSYQHIVSDDRWLELEQGRQVDIRGNVNRASHAEIWPSVLARSRRGGWIIFQDNGGQVTDARWRQFLAQIVDETPDDRCILAVLPVFHPNWSQTAYEDSVRKANIMVQEISQQPCHDWVRWNQKVMADPSLVYDGQHPSEAGAQWIGAAVDAAIGYRG